MSCAHLQMSGLLIWCHSKLENNAEKRWRTTQNNSHSSFSLALHVGSATHRPVAIAINSQQLHRCMRIQHRKNTQTFPTRTTLSLLQCYVFSLDIYFGIINNIHFGTCLCGVFYIKVSECFVSSLFIKSTLKLAGYIHCNKKGKLLPLLLFFLRLIEWSFI